MSEPSLLISDTSVIIDLQNSGLIPAFFRLPYLIAASDFTKQTEVLLPGWDYLTSLGLTFISLDSSSVLELTHLKEKHPHPSLPDLSAYLIARIEGGILLTGDKELRKLAISTGVSVHGVLWVLDEMVLHSILDPFNAAKGLKEMLAKGARLPQKDCEHRLRKWKR